MATNVNRMRCCARVILATLFLGCSESNQTAQQSNSGAVAPESAETRDAGTIAGGEDSGADSMRGDDPSDQDQFTPLGLSALSGGNPAAIGSSGQSSDQQLQDVIDQLKPLQVLLGKWRGTTRREYEGFKAVDSHEWIWDLQTDPRQPALTVTSDKSPYMRRARLTWEPEDQQFALQLTDAAGVSRTLFGDFTDPVHEEVGSDDRLHRVFRLQFTESAAPTEGGGNEFWQVAIAQQENNRYLLELEKRRGSASFRRFDTVSTQREGTSFAADDSDYGEKTCIISEGLGTTEIVYKGRSYWVCCSGCKAAFEDDPEKWIALAAKRDEEKDKQGNAVP